LNGLARPGSSFNTDYAFLEDSTKDWLLGIAKYHFLLYLSDQTAVDYFDSVGRELTPEHPYYQNLQVGYNLMQAQNIRNVYGVDYNQQTGIWEPETTQTFDYVSRVGGDTTEVEIQILGTWKDFQGVSF
jgi:hypothetical protein